MRAASSGCWKSGPMSTSKPEIGIGCGDNFRPAIVSILPHLGDEDTRTAAMLLGELIGQMPDLFGPAGSVRIRIGKHLTRCG